MKLLRTGELYSLDRRAGIDAQVESAVRRFTNKHGVGPIHICWNPGDLFKDKHAENPPPVDLTLPPGHLWLELKDKEWRELPFDPLDPQRDRVYKAEESVFPRDKDVFMSLEELQVEADRILSLPWFGRMFAIKKLAIKDGRGSKWSRSGDGSVHLIRISRVRDVLIHEIIHHACPPGTEWHGAVFCGLLLYFIGRLYDQRTKDKLRRAFKRAEPPVVWDKRLARFGDLSRNGMEGEA